MVRSSYTINNYGSVFRALILAHQPNTVVECGVLDGYSTMCIAHALKFNKEKKGIHSEFFAYDLWDGYNYNHGDYDKVDNMLKKNDLDVKLIRQDAFLASYDHDDFEVDFLHMDISNDGDVLLETLKEWGSKITTDGIIAFEGGTEERDKGWIKKYNKKPINPELINNPEVYENWDVQIFSLFPGLTLLWKK